VSTLDIFGIYPILHRRDLQKTNQPSIHIWHQLQPHSPPPNQSSSSSDPEKAPKSLDDEIGVITSSSLHHGFDRPTFSREKGPLLLYSLCFLLCFSQRDFGQLSFLPISLRLPHFCNPALYEQAFITFAERSLASIVPCFEIKVSGLGLASLNILPVEAVVVAEWVVVIHEGRQGDYQ
jgi:hypothetical protein